MSEFVREIADADFEETVGASAPTLVDFWAPWCGPCKMAAPMLEEIGREFSGRLNVAKINVDENTVSPAKFGIRGIPTMILFREGRPVDQIVGLLPKEHMVAWLEQRIG